MTFDLNYDLDITNGPLPTLANLPYLPGEIQRKIYHHGVPYKLEETRIANMNVQVGNTMVWANKQRMFAANSSSGCSLTYDYGIGYGAYLKKYNLTNRYPTSKGLAGELEIVARLDSQLGEGLVNFLPKDEEQFKLCGYTKRAQSPTEIKVMLNLYNPFYFGNSDQDLKGERYLDWLIYDIDFSAMLVKMSEEFPRLNDPIYENYPRVSIEDAFYLARTENSIRHLVNLVYDNRHSTE